MTRINSGGPRSTSCSGFISLPGLPAKGTILDTTVYGVIQTQRFPLSPRGHGPLFSIFSWTGPPVDIKSWITASTPQYGALTGHPFYVLRILVVLGTTPS